MLGLIGEIVLTVLGLRFLIMGKSMEKPPRKSGRFRLLGAFMILFWPVVLGGFVIWGIVWAVQNPGRNADTFADDIKVIGLVAELAALIVWAVASRLWYKSILRGLDGGAAAPAERPNPFAPQNLPPRR